MSDVEAQQAPAGRVRKFDRPPPPHDWRWWVGGIGKILIACGLLMFGFVAYQLWGTGIETARAQNSLENEFEDLLATSPSDATPSDATPVGSAPAGSAPVDSRPVGSTPVESVPVDTPSDPADPTAATASDGTLPPIEEGDPIARIELPSLGVDKIVVAGVDKNDLKKGPGHYPETPMPGQLGNAAIAGHRTTFGQPFYDVDKLENGDEIVVTTLAGRFVYRVTGQQIVAPSEYRVIATTDPTRATLTLTSCHPKYTARERIVITADLDEAASTGVVGEATLNYGRPLELDSGSDDIDPTNTITDSSTDIDAATPETDDNDEVGAVDADNADDAAVDPTAEAAIGDDQIDEGIADAFAEGWFSDPGANGQVLLWGLLLAGIGILSYLISKKTKRDWVGLLVGIVPFIVVLYFFFQNVNRLLPPNL